MKSRLALAGAVMAAAALVSCSNTTGGTAVCPGCGTASEPSFGTPSPSISTPTAAPPTPTESPTPGGDTQTLPPDSDGFVFVETKSGRTRCQLNTEYVGCESAFSNAPVVDGAPANGVKVTADGDVTWILGNLGNIPTVALDYRTYSAAGWTIEAGPDGTRFVNDSTGHGMVVAVEGVQAF